MRLQADNNAKTTLTDSIDPEDEIIKVASDLDLPSAPCRLTIDDGQNIEIVHLEEVLEEGLKVERGQEGTEAQSFSEGTGVDNRFTEHLTGHFRTMRYSSFTRTRMKYLVTRLVCGCLLKEQGNL